MLHLFRIIHFSDLNNNKTLKSLIENWIEWNVAESIMYHVTMLNFVNKIFVS